MAAVDLSKLVKEKRFWVASFLVVWAAALQVGAEQGRGFPHACYPDLRLLFPSGPEAPVPRIQMKNSWTPPSFLYVCINQIRGTWCGCSARTPSSTSSALTKQTDPTPMIPHLPLPLLSRSRSRSRSIPLLVVFWSSHASDGPVNHFIYRLLACNVTSSTLGWVVLVQNNMLSVSFRSTVSIIPQIKFSLQAGNFIGFVFLHTPFLQQY